MPGAAVRTLIRVLTIVFELLMAINLTARATDEKVVLFWTKDWFPYDVKFQQASLKIDRMCPYRCRFTSQHEEVSISDVIVFHTYFLNMSDLPPRGEGQIWALWSLEPPVHTPAADVGRHFNWTISYHSSSEVVVRSFRVVPVDARFPGSESAHPNWQVCGADFPWIPRRRQCLPPHSRHLGRKRKLVAWFVSNCNTGGGRFDYVKELQRYIPVDIYGKCGNLSCGSQHRKSSHCYRMLEENYMFYLAFENNLCSEYVTEKLYNTLLLDVVPVVFGSGYYWRTAPPGSYINALEMSPWQLSRFLLRVSATPHLYLSYFRWRRNVVPIEDTTSWLCDLCQRAYQVRGGTTGLNWSRLSQGKHGEHQADLGWVFTFGRCMVYDGGGAVRNIFW